VKEDILEQLVDEYLQHKGYFTRHNIKFKPSKNHPDYESNKDAVPSDIDVIGIHPNRRGVDRVVAVSCKSWQSGFNPNSKISEIEGNKTVSGREAWKGFREITKEKWTSAFIDKIEEITGTRKFTYVTAVTVVKGDRLVWETYEPFRKILQGNPVKILTFSDILDDLLPDLDTTPVSSEVGRVLQLFKASGWLGNNR
jgi:hypothetical protein